MRYGTKSRRQLHCAHLWHTVKHISPFEPTTLGADDIAIKPNIMSHQTDTSLSISGKSFKRLGQLNAFAQSRCSVYTMNIDNFLRNYKTAWAHYHIAIVHYRARPVHYKPTEAHHTRPILGTLGTRHFAVERQSRSLDIDHQYHPIAIGCTIRRLAITDNGVRILLHAVIHPRLRHTSYRPGSRHSKSGRGIRLVRTHGCGTMAGTMAASMPPTTYHNNGKAYKRNAQHYCIYHILFHSGLFLA